MTNGDEEKPIRRILIALDASLHSLAALQAATELASHLDAEIVCIFVEDINLLRIGELPFSRQISFYSGTSRQLGRQQIEEELRAQANRARQALSLQARQAGLRTTFRVIRGIVPEEILQASEEADLIVMGKAGWSHRRRVGSTTRFIISQGSRQTLVLQYGARLGLTVGVIYDGSEASQKALAAARSLLNQRNGYLNVIVVADDNQSARRFQSEVTHWLEQKMLTARYRWLVGPHRQYLASLVKSEQLGALILPADGERFSPEDIEALIEKLEIPVLLVR
jgi:nucleotide-binding universal stress UspA family protein